MAFISSRKPCRMWSVESVDSKLLSFQPIQTNSVENRKRQTSWQRCPPNGGRKCTHIHLARKYDLSWTFLLNPFSFSFYSPLQTTTCSGVVSQADTPPHLKRKGLPQQRGTILQLCTIFQLCTILRQSRNSFPQAS